MKYNLKMFTVENNFAKHKKHIILIQLVDIN